MLHRSIIILHEMGLVQQIGRIPIGSKSFRQKNCKKVLTPFRSSGTLRDSPPKGGLRVAPEATKREIIDK